MKKILGLNSIGFNTSASLIINGKIVGAVEEERLNREKRTRKFPIHSIKYLLENNNLNFHDLDDIGISWNPMINLEKYQKNFHDTNRYIPEILFSTLANFEGLIKKGKDEDYLTQTLKIGNKKINIFFIKHHLCHASNFFFSGFDKASILTVDAFGEKQSTGMFYSDEKKIKKIFSQDFPHSLGSFYSTFTEICGFKPQSDEWKLMGAAAYGKNNRYYKKLQNLIHLKSDGSFELDLNYFNFYNFHKPNFYNKKLLNFIGLEKNENREKLKQPYYDLAFAAQKIFEDIYFHLINNLYKKKPNQNLVISGGCALNSLANGKILKKTKFRNLYIPPVPDDSGAGLGAACYINTQIHSKKTFRLSNNYLGPKFSNQKVEKLLKLYKLNYKKIKDVNKAAAQKISEGNIIGWFQNNLEFGDRALGNRSIIADPRDKNMKEKINRCVKYREKFRPFAPAVISEQAGRFFEIEKTSNFMEKAVKIKRIYQKLVPAVVHEDKTCRLQTVDKINNEKFYFLIKEFEKITKIPILLNTSLNYQGDPIACSPEDALKTFFLSGLDFLYINDFEIYK